MAAPMRVHWFPLERQFRASVASCTACTFHFGDGTVTLCQEHATWTVLDALDHLVAAA